MDEQKYSFLLRIIQNQYFLNIRSKEKSKGTLKMIKSIRSTEMNYKIAFLIKFPSVFLFL